VSRTRVGLVCGYLDPTRDGVAAYTRRLAVHLRSAGLDPVMVTTHELARAEGADVIGVTERWDTAGVASAARAIRRLDLDVLHVQFAPSAFGFTRAVGLLPLFLPRRVPLVVTLHEYGVAPQSIGGAGVRSMLWSLAERCLYAERETLLLVPRAQCLLVPSQEHMRVLRARVPRQTIASREVPIGLNVEIATGRNRDAARARVRRELGVAPDASLVAFFGFLHPDKGLDRLIAAVATVRAQRPGTQLLLIGGAASHSVSAVAAHRLRKELEQVAATFGVHDQVHFTGYLPDADVSRLLFAADVAAFPFDAGVTRKSSSLLTALAAGLPVVATAADTAVGTSVEADGALWVRPGDTAELADALARVLGNRRLADRLRAAGAARAACHSWDAIAAAHAEVYARAWPAASAPSRGQKQPSTAGWWLRRRWEGTGMSLRERMAHAAERLAVALRRGASAAERPPGARATEDPSLFRPLVYGDPARLHIAPTAVVNNALFNLSSGEITVGEYAFFGHNVSILTGTHDWTTFGRERQVSVPKSGRDVVIEEGAWVSSNAIVVAPCRIGAHAVVGVGALVLHDVEPYTVVAGNPARVLRTIPRPGEAESATVDPDAGAAGAVTAG
jgi:glycosyltransferase involved in cell wall biosynthesis/acetyltransferase-like isoleucine patch superfamily enzyme